MDKLKKGLAIVFACLILTTVMSSCGKKNVGCPNAFKITATK